MREGLGWSSAPLARGSLRHREYHVVVALEGRGFALGAACVVRGVRARLLRVGMVDRAGPFRAGQRFVLAYGCRAASGTMSSPVRTPSPAAVASTVYVTSITPLLSDAADASPCTWYCA